MQISRTFDTIKLTIASGATQSEAFSVAGFALASLEVPAGFKGNLRVLQSNQNKLAGNQSFYPCKDDTSTGIVQTIVGVEKPSVVALRPEFLVCRVAKLRATSAQTGASGKILYLFGKG